MYWRMHCTMNARSITGASLATRPGSPLTKLAVMPCRGLRQHREMCRGPDRALFAEADGLAGEGLRSGGP